MAQRWMRPIAHWLTDPAIWHFNRRSVARGAALGLFVSFILPIGQILIAAVFASFMRGNLLVAAAATFVANPFTFPAIYFGAYRLGTWLLDRPRTITFEHIASARSMMDVFAGASMPTVLGLFVFATISAALGYLLVAGVWRLALVRQWRSRPWR